MLSVFHIFCLIQLMYTVFQLNIQNRKKNSILINTVKIDICVYMIFKSALSLHCVMQVYKMRFHFASISVCIYVFIFLLSSSMFLSSERVWYAMEWLKYLFLLLRSIFELTYNFDIREDECEYVKKRTKTNIQFS